MTSRSIGGDRASVSSSLNPWAFYRNIRRTTSISARSIGKELRFFCAIGKWWAKQTAHSSIHHLWMKRKRPTRADDINLIFRYSLSIAVLRLFWIKNEVPRWCIECDCLVNAKTLVLLERVEQTCALSQHTYFITHSRLQPRNSQFHSLHPHLALSALPTRSRTKHLFKHLRTIESEKLESLSTNGAIFLLTLSLSFSLPLTLCAIESKRKEKEVFSPLSSRRHCSLLNSNVLLLQSIAAQAFNSIE